MVGWCLLVVGSCGDRGLTVGSAVVVLIGPACCGKVGAAVIVCRTYLVCINWFAVWRLGRIFERTWVGLLVVVV